MWQTSRLTIHNLLYGSKVKIHHYNICCTYQLPCLNTAAAAAAAAAVAAVGAADGAAVAAAVSGTDSVAGNQQVVLRPPVG